MQNGGISKVLLLHCWAHSAMRLCATRCAGAQRWIRFPYQLGENFFAVESILPWNQFCQVQSREHKFRLRLGSAAL